MRAVLRVDASLNMGTGHVMRCLTLANALCAGGADVSFISRNLKGNLIDRIEREGFAVAALPATEAEVSGMPAHEVWAEVSWQQDAEETKTVLKTIQPDWLIVDHYAFDRRWEQFVRDSVGKLMVIDDLADRPHDCEILLDQNFGRTVRDYGRLVPLHCRLWLGPRHALLRPQFAMRRAARKERGPDHRIKHILIQMGGIDQGDYTAEALAVLQKLALPPDIRISVVLSSAAPSLDAVNKLASSMQRPTAVMVDVEDMAGLMEGSDLAIGSGGGATYERMYMGLHSILRPTARNQIEPLRKMAAAGLIELYQDAADLAKKVERALHSGIPSVPMVVDLITDKLAVELIQGGVTLQTLRPRDLRRTFHWLQDPRLRSFFLMDQKPDLSRHFSYWRNILSDHQQYVFSILDGPTHIGNAGLKNINFEKSEAEIWLYIGDSKNRGKGVGRVVLGHLEEIVRDRLGFGRVVLHVGRFNEPAMRLYKSSGYVQVVEQLERTKAFSSLDVIYMEKKL